MFLKEVVQAPGLVWPNSEPFLFDLMRDAVKAAKAAMETERAAKVLKLEKQMAAA